MMNNDKMLDQLNGLRIGEEVCNKYGIEPTSFAFYVFSLDCFSTAF